ncbi:MAG: peptide MFS transporter [Bacteroidetes bacterium]|nr:peptide MFS transporter [Bacteroidota bacterium]
MFKQHPKGLYVLFFTEMWERFSYYGMRAILTLYMINALMYDKVFTSSIYGWYTGLVYLTPLAGGYIADRYWGNRKSIIVGSILMAIGQFTLAASGYYYTASVDSLVYSTFSLNIQQILFLLGLTILIIGNGFFKPNIATMVGSLYPKESIKLRDSAFTIFYMGINLGALIAPLVTGGLGDTGNPADFKYGFLAAGIGMLFGLTIFYFGKNKHLVTPEGVPVGLVPEKKAELENKNTNNSFSQNQILAVIGLFLIIFLVLMFVLNSDIITSFIFSSMIAVPTLIILDKSLTKIEKNRIAVIYILAFFVIFFWSAFEQAGVSLTFFAEEQTDRVIIWLNNYVIPTSFFQTINPLAIFIFAPLFAALWTKLDKRGREPATPIKMAIGLMLLAFGFIFLVVGANIADTGVKVSPFWLVGAYMFHTFGELSLSPIGLSMVTKLSPLKFSSLLMGVWFLANAAANVLAGQLSTLYPEAGHATSLFGFSINGLGDFFTIFISMAVIASIILFIISKKLISMMHGVQ